MKRSVLMDERELVRKALSAVMKELGPAESLRFLSIFRSRKGADSVRRHRAWQAKLDKDAFFDQVFAPKR